MHKRSFQALKRTFMHVSGLPPAYFDNKTKNFIKLVLLSKYAGGRPEGLKRTFMHAQVFPQHILITKLIYKVFGFIIKILVGKT